MQPDATINRAIMEEQRKQVSPPPPPEDGTFTCPINWIYSLRYDYTGASGAVAEMLDVILQAWNGDFSTMPNDGNLKATARGWKAVIRASLKKQRDKKDQTSNAGQISAENRRKQKEIAESLTADNQQETQRPSTTVNERQRECPNVNVNLLNVNNPPLTPQGARIGGGGNKFSFKDFAKAVAMAEKSVPEVITDAIGRTQVVWRVADYGGKYSNLIGELVYNGGAEGVELTNKIQSINVSYQTKTSFQAFSLAYELARLNNPGASVAIANEVDANPDETDIYETMLEKVKYIKAGKIITNYNAFAKARK